MLKGHLNYYAVSGNRKLALDDGAADGIGHHQRDGIAPQAVGEKCAVALTT